MVGLLLSERTKIKPIAAGIWVQLGPKGLLLFKQRSAKPWKSWQEWRDSNPRPPVLETERRHYSPVRASLYLSRLANKYTHSPPSYSTLSKACWGVWDQRGLRTSGRCRPREPRLSNTADLAASHSGQFVFRAGRLRWSRCGLAGCLLETLNGPRPSPRSQIRTSICANS
jgi:hypothetical protein